MDLIGVTNELKILAAQGFTSIELRKDLLMSSDQPAIQLLVLRIEIAVRSQGGPHPFVVVFKDEPDRPLDIFIHSHHLGLASPPVYSRE